MDCADKEEKSLFCKNCKKALCPACGDEHKRLNHSIYILLDYAKKSSNEFSEYFSKVMRQAHTSHRNLSVMLSYVESKKKSLLQVLTERVRALQLSISSRLNDWGLYYSEEIQKRQDEIDLFINDNPLVDAKGKIEHMMSSNQSEDLAQYIALMESEETKAKIAYSLARCGDINSIKHDIESYAQTMTRINAMLDIQKLITGTGINAALVKFQKDCVLKIKKENDSLKDIKRVIQECVLLNSQLNEQIQVLRDQKNQIESENKKLLQERGEVMKREGAKANTELSKSSSHSDSHSDTSEKMRSQSVVIPSARDKIGDSFIHYFDLKACTLNVYNLGRNAGFSLKILPDLLGEDFDSIQIAAKILLCGGMSTSTFSMKKDTTEIPISNQAQLKVVPKAFMNKEKGSHKLVQLSDNFIYCIGGKDDKDYLNLCERYDVGGNKWEVIAPLNEKKAHIAATCYAEKVIYTIGGFNGKALATIEAFTLAEQKWKILTPKKATGWGPLCGCGAIQVRAEAIIIWGGAKSDSGPGVDSTFAFFPQTEEIALIKPALKTKEWFFMRQPSLYKEQVSIYGLHNSKIHRFDVKKHIWELY